MKFSLFVLFSAIVLSSCGEKGKQGDLQKNAEKPLKSIKVERYSVTNGNPDSTTLSSYIMKSFDENGNESKSIYYTTDDQVMMQFVNTYENGLKTKISWVDGQGNGVKYVVNTYDENNRISKSESFSMEGEFQNGSLHRWKENGKLEEKAPIEEGEVFRPNAIYTYNDDQEFAYLKEYDDKDSLYATVRWEYTEFDDFDHWIERQWITNDTINRIEKRIITYRE